MELSYARTGSGSIEWTRDGEFLVITLFQLSRREIEGKRPTVPLAIVAGVIVVILVVAHLLWGVEMLVTLLAFIGIPLALYLLLSLLSLLQGRRKLVIRVSRQTLLIDEFSLRPWSTAWRAEVYRTGAWPAEQIVSVAAAGRALRITGRRGVHTMGLDAYNPADVAWAADAIARELAGAVE